MRTPRSLAHSPSHHVTNATQRRRAEQIPPSDLSDRQKVLQDGEDDNAEDTRQTKRKQTDTAQCMQVVKDVLLELQKVGSTEHKYHLLRETRCSNGQVRTTVLFSPAITFRRGRVLGTTDELSEVLLRYTLADEHSASVSRYAPSIAGGGNRSGGVATVGDEPSVETGKIEREHTVSPRRVARIRAERDWTRIDEDESKEILRARTPGFQIPAWLGNTYDNLELQASHPHEVLEISQEAARNFDSLKSKEVVWIYRKLFFSLYKKLIEIRPRFLGQNMQCKNFTLPWLRKRMKVGHKILYGRPALPQLRDFRNENSNQAIRWILAGSWQHSITKKHHSQNRLSNCY